jgi:hypothetical protein
MGQWAHALTAALVVVALSAGAATLNAQQNAGTTTNGLEPTPILGWSSCRLLCFLPYEVIVVYECVLLCLSGF